MSDWTHPIHKKGIRSYGFDTMVTGELTDKKIDQYVRQGFYSNRKYYLGELRKLHATKKIFEPVTQKRLVYNMETQELEERES